MYYPDHHQSHFQPSVTVAWDFLVPFLSLCLSLQTCVMCPVPIETLGLLELACWEQMGSSALITHDNTCFLLW